MSAAESYIQRTKQELDVKYPGCPGGYVAEMARLAIAVRRADVRKHVMDLDSPDSELTVLSQLIRHLVTLDAPFLPETSTHFLCGETEGNFVKALTEPRQSGRKRAAYRQTVIYTHEGKAKLITKGDPHGKLATLVCDEIPGMPQIVLGMIGKLHDRRGFPPAHYGLKPSVVIQEIDKSFTFQNARPSTFVAFPAEVRASAPDNGKELKEADVQVHRTKRLEDFRKRAQEIVDQHE